MLAQLADQEYRKLPFSVDDLTKPKRGERLYVPEFKGDAPKGHRFYLDKPLVSKVDRWDVLEMNSMLAEKYGGAWRQPEFDE